MRQKRQPIKTCDSCQLRSVTTQKVINRVIRKKFNQLCAVCLREEMIALPQALEQQEGSKT